MLKALRKHLKSKKSTNFMQYMKISRKETNDYNNYDNNWINFRNLDEIANDKRDCFEFITSNNINNYKHNNYYNPNNGQKDKEIKVVKEFEAIQLNNQHLHALHRFRRHNIRKRGISSDRGIVISFQKTPKVSIVNRRDFYYRFGKQEEEAIACFDFLNDMICDTDSIYDSTDSEQHFRSTSRSISCSTSRSTSSLTEDRNSQLSFSDSCVEYYYDSSD